MWQGRQLGDTPAHTQLTHRCPLLRVTPSVAPSRSSRREDFLLPADTAGGGDEAATAVVKWIRPIFCWRGCPCSGGGRRTRGGSDSGAQERC